MKTVEFKKAVHLPNLDDFVGAYPRFVKLTQGPTRQLLQALLVPEVVIRAQIVAEFGYPPHLAVAAQCLSISESNPDIPWDHFTKQAVGSLLRLLMEANDFKAAEKKGNVPHAAFATGELYIRR